MISTLKKPKKKLTRKSKNKNRYKPVSKVTTLELRKLMVKYIIGEVKKFPKRNVSEGLVEFSERKRFLSAGTSARPGPYRYSTVPMWREPSKCLSEYSNINEMVIMKGTQTGGTEIMMNHELYCIEYGIGPVQYITSDDTLAGEHMEKRIDPMLKDSGMLDKITPPVQKKSNKSTGDTKRSKSFGGTFLRVTGARSESKLSSLPSRILHIDEIDKYLIQFADGGNPVEKAIRRTDSFGNLMLVVYISTPKNQSTSQIEPLFKQGTMEYYYFQCPECGEYQKLEWDRIKWDKNEAGKLLLEYDENNILKNKPVWMECKNKECDHKIRDYEKVDFLQEKGYGGTSEWIASKKPDRPGLRSFHASGLYGFRSWLNIVVQWDKIDGDPVLLQDFINDVLGETFSQKIDKPDEHYLMSRVETDWERGQIPDDVKIMTLGADIHPGRIEWHLIGWGRRKESWSIDYDSMIGDIYEPNDPAWDKLEEILSKEYNKIDGDPIRIQVALLDAQGKAAEVVKTFCERFPFQDNMIQGVFPSLGKTTLASVVKEHESTIVTPEILLNDQLLKTEIYNHLKKKKPAVGSNFPVGYMHFHSDYPEEFFKQMTAEEVEEIQNTKGTHTEFYITNKKQRRNEVLDTTKMALGGLYFMYYKYFKLLNKRRKLRKKKEVPADWNYFWSLFGIDEE